ncbi:uncharacterized protein V1516DRAFT_620469 [Lipomyces oligophaga]|uniref:uncharacterized protein n=1 Tax=Lipomyces oligophaga TaxID=45792 RepID=UPI0034CE5EF7
MGIDVILPSDATKSDSVTYGFSIHDGYYSTDFALKTENLPQKLSPERYPAVITEWILEEIKEYSKTHLFKFVAVGLLASVKKFCPRLCSRLWSELDILPFVFADDIFSSALELEDNPVVAPTCDEKADSLARKVIMHFGPSGLPRVVIGYRNKVEVDDAGLIQMVDLIDYERSCSPNTWKCFKQLVTELTNIQINGHKGVRIAFFNATPQGGGVALMRHALIRLLSLVELQVSWYVPRPNPIVFRITKNNHNIIQGVADPTLKLDDTQREQFTHWIDSNFERYWSSGPLNERKPPGVDIVIVDDPQMVGLIPRAKAAGIPVIYRSHIEIRSDLINTVGSPQEGVWNYLYDSGIKDCDLFISHPVRGFIPEAIDISKVGLMGAATDWLDGLNKDLSRWDTFFYMGQFKKECDQTRANKLAFPLRPYICQIARFDPSKGIPDVLESYRKLREMMDEDLPIRKIPQLVIAGHGAIDDPDGTMIYDEIIKSISEPEFETISSDIIVMCLGPSDQLLNCILSNSTVVLQLSHREGFEVKVSEAIHKGKPTIAYYAGGIPLQVQDKRNGYLCEVGNTDEVARRLYTLFLDTTKYQRFSEYAVQSVSDEVHTVGNVSAWLYLFKEIANGRTVRPDGQWVYDMMRKDAGVPWEKGENRLPRTILKPLNN